MRAQKILLRSWSLYQWPMKVFRQVSPDVLDLPTVMFCFLYYIVFHVVIAQKASETYKLSPCLADCPAPLVSTDSVAAAGPVEASIEDLHCIQSEPSVGLMEPLIQTDSVVFSSPSVLEEKLDRELRYHKHGSYTCDNQPDVASCQNNSNNFLLNRTSFPNNTVRQPEEDRTSNVSSVHSWTKAEPVQPTSHEGARYYPTNGLYESMTSSIDTPSMSTSTPSLSQFNQQHPHSHYDRQQSWPVYPVSETGLHDAMPGRLLAPSKSGSLKDTGTHRPTCPLLFLSVLNGTCCNDDLCLYVCLYTRISLYWECKRDPDWQQQPAEHPRLRVP